MEIFICLKTEGYQIFLFNLDYLQHLKRITDDRQINVLPSLVLHPKLQFSNKPFHLLQGS